MMGSLHPSDGKSESFSQIYILDPDEQTRLRMNMIGGLEPQILRELEEYLRTHNKYVDVFQQSTTETDALNVNIVLTTQHSSDPRRYNAPSVPEIAAIIPDNVRKQNVLVNKRQHDNKLEFVSTLNPMCDPLHYVILFPHGDQGWRLDAKRTDGSNMTLMQYAAARMMIRPGQEHLFR